jgi:hypothetical protein
MRSLTESRHGENNEEGGEGDDVMGWTMSSWVEEKDVKEGGKTRWVDGDML